MAAAGTFVTAKLMRTDNQTPWGFRLQGGQEFNIPLAMGKVSEGSLAEQAGVQVGDIILKINGKECDTMRHKEAQDAIVNAGNYLELYLERGPMNTWKPTVTPVGSFDIRNKSHSMEPPTFTKTSLAKQTEEYSAIGSGHNSSAKPFSPPKLVHKQFNSPINLYSEKSLEETLNAHTQVLSSGATGINFMRPDAPVNKDSAVFQMVQEEERRKAKGLSDSPDKNGFHDGGMAASDGPIKHVQAPSGVPNPPKQDDRNRNICASCERLIVGVFVRVNNKSLHADCFVCATCGSSLKNIGYFNINDKLYCDIHARQIRAVLGESGAQQYGQSNLGPGPGSASQPASHLGARSNVPASSTFDGGYSSSGGNANIPSNNYAPPSINSYQSSNFSSTHNGFQSYSQEPKKFSPVVPPTAPKPNFNANTNRNSMFVNLPSSYNFSQSETQSSVNQRFNMPNEQPIQSQTNSMNNSAANYLSSTYASSTQTTYSMPPPGQESIAPKMAPGPNYGPMPAAPVPPAGITNATRTNSSSTTTTFGAKTNITDSRSAPKRGKGFLQSQLTGGVIPFCGYCSQPIRGQYIMALNKTWCPNHFVCANTLCKRSLEQSGFVEEQGRLYCDTCYETHFAPNCTKCHQRIKGDCLNALDRQWHPECFTCTHCRKPFGNSSFYLEDSYPYCEKDWNDLFTTKCVGCGYPIAAGDRWVEALNQNYHSNCFQCTVCHNNLEGQSFFAKGGRPYCKAHAR